MPVKRIECEECGFDFVADSASSDVRCVQCRPIEAYEVLPNRKQRSQPAYVAPLPTSNSAKLKSQSPHRFPVGVTILGAIVLGVIAAYWCWLRSPGEEAVKESPPAIKDSFTSDGYQSPSLQR